MTAEPRPALDDSPENGKGNEFMNRRLRTAGILIVVGALVQGLSMVWNNPLSFLAFVGIGGLAVALGIAAYLLALVSPGPKS